MNKIQYNNSLLNKLNFINSTDGPFFCIEVSPPKEINKINNFISSINKLINNTTTNNSFLFLSIVAHAENNPTNFSLPNSSTSIASKILNEDILPKNSHLILHITGKSFINFPHSFVDFYFTKLKQLGINNYFVLSGDLPKRENYNYLNYNLEISPKSPQLDSLHLIKRIKSNKLSTNNNNNLLTFAVAGYPECHPFAYNRNSDILFLKRKIFEGNANFVICQFSFDRGAEKFFQFVADCRQAGINVHFIPGILLFQSFSSLLKFSSLTKIKIPQEMFNLLSSHRYNDNLIKYYSLWLAYNICQKLLTKSLLNNIRAIHLFNSNQWEMTRYL
uniref:Uncharacterized protein n=1 Tax=Meloidogyne enterolobii TaxID=390850 RepID=A0A6V7VPZ4_MELEN|nr:unnamed protein product [Meloidogyne enterolobii]